MAIKYGHPFCAWINNLGAPDELQKGRKCYVKVLVGGEAALGAPAVAGKGGNGGNGIIIIRW